MRLPCADLTMGTVDALDSWVYQSCLVDAANAINSHDDDDLELNFGIFGIFIYLPHNYIT